MCKQIESIKLRVKGLTAKLFYYVLKAFCDFLPLNNEILLESFPDLSCNTWPLFQYMIREDLNEKINITWMVTSPQNYKNKYENFKGVSFIEISPVGLINRVKKYIRCYRAKCIITSNRHISKKNVSKKQLNIYLGHGTPIKDAKSYFKSVVHCDYIITQGPLFNTIWMEQCDLKMTQIIPLGYPRNDTLFKDKKSINRIYYNIYSYNKIILWCPTFREHMNKKRIDVDSHFPLGIPILYTKDDVFELNDFLLKRNLLLLLKPHPAQDIEVLKNLNVSNLRFLLNCDLEKYGIQTYELLSQVDALITDYSSIFFDFMLLDKPIGFTLDDFERYKSQHGFAVQEPLKWMPGEHIYNLHDMLLFLQNIYDNKDVEREKRRSFTKNANVAPYDMATKRVYEFIVDKLNL